jgi:hypothetical protein
VGIPIADRVLAWLGIAIALASALGAIYDRTTALTVEPWQATYRTAFITPMVDDTYGDVMALRCGRWGSAPRSIVST